MIKPRKTQTTRKFNMVFSYSEKWSENDLDMTLNLIIARNNGFVKKKYTISLPNENQKFKALNFLTLAWYV